MKSLLKVKSFHEFVSTVLILMIIYLLWVVSWRDYYTLKLPQKYILNWNTNSQLNTLQRKYPFSKLQCEFSNCILTDNKYLLSDFRLYDAIVFIELDLSKPLDLLPARMERVESQLYIFFSIESASNFPSCEIYHDNFFNLTFTSRLNSDLVWNYFKVRNLTGNVVAPSINVDWRINKSPINPEIKRLWTHRRKAAAWLVSNCLANSLRQMYITELQNSLFHYSLQIDVYGTCSRKKCPNNDCEKMFARDYYFYIAFENSFSTDYVTEKVLHGYDNYVVPIVDGAANYSRFLPPGSYINAQDYHPHHLAHLIYEAMTDQSKYEKYFSWTNSYTIKDNTNTALCNLCKALNINNTKHTSAYSQFRLWWNTLKGMKWCLPQEYWNDTALINGEDQHILNKLAQVSI